MPAAPRPIPPDPLIADDDLFPELSDLASPQARRAALREYRWPGVDGFNDAEPSEPWPVIIHNDRIPSPR